MMELYQNGFRKVNPFFHRKIAKSGNSRYLAVGKILPEDWHVLRVEVAELKDKHCILQITKLD
uniref:Uncharacterized protein n=1 Tax=viral metagenome TaxID=1070528 RepID=A0A6H2A4P3_9ZZZZ